MAGIGNRDVTSETTDSGGRGGVWLCGGAIVVAIGLFWLVRGALIDDAYITLSYARNVATNLHWGLIPTETANSATSPLNVMLLAAAAVLVRFDGAVHPVWGLAVVFVGSTAAFAWWWTRVAEALRLPPLVPALGVALVLLNPFVLSATGLEVLLIPALLVGMLAEAVRGRPVAFGVLAGLTVLARLDLAVFIVPLALASAGVRRRLPRAAGAALAVSLPWFAWSWWSFGSAIPDTFVIKTLQRSFGSWTFGNGLGLYYERDALATAVTVIPAVLGLVATLGWVAARLRRRSGGLSQLAPAAALGIGGIAYYAVYVLLAVPPYQWYYVPSFAALSTSFCVLLGAILRGQGYVRYAVAFPTIAVVVCLIGGSLVADVRGGVPWRLPVIFGNWAVPADYARAGRGLDERVGSATVIAPPEIGTLAYFCRCSIVDAFADRGRVVPLIEERIDTAGPVAGALLKLNYLRLDRDQQPRPATYQLVYEPGPTTEPGQWPTWSPATGTGHLRLIELPSG